MPGARHAAVVATESFEHLRAPGADLDRICGCVTPGGVVVVLTSLTDGVADLAHWHYALDATHIGLFAQRTFAWIETRWPLRVLEGNGRNLTVMRRA